MKFAFLVTLLAKTRGFRGGHGQGCRASARLAFLRCPRPAAAAVPAPGAAESGRGPAPGARARDVGGGVGARRRESWGRWMGVGPIPPPLPPKTKKKEAGCSFGFSLNTSQKRRFPQKEKHPNGWGLFPFSKAKKGGLEYDTQIGVPIFAVLEVSYCSTKWGRLFGEQKHKQASDWGFPSLRNTQMAGCWVVIGGIGIGVRFGEHILSAFFFLKGGWWGWKLRWGWGNLG